MYRRRERVKELQGTKIYRKKEENNLDWTRLEAVEVLLNVHQGLSWGAGSHINSGPYLQGQKAVLAWGVFFDFFIFNFDFSLYFLLLFPPGNKQEPNRQT
jgi:hypothetical protein